MRRRTRLAGSRTVLAASGAVLVIVLAFGIGSCRGGRDHVEPAWLPGADVDLSVPMRPFDGLTALEDATRLARLESGSSGSRGIERARRYVAEALHDMGAPTSLAARRPDGAAPERGGPTAEGSAEDDAEDDASPPTGPVIGVLPGRSDDVILLAAAYDPLASTNDDERAWVDAMSGAAVLLEVGRSLAARPRPYTIWLAFLEQDLLEGPRLEGDAPASTAQPNTAGVGEARVGIPLERVRLAVFFESLARADLRVARDLRSHRVHREAFWDSARALGLGEVFVADAPFGSPHAAHYVLIERDFRSVVALVGEASFDAPIVDATDDSTDHSRGDASADALDDDAFEVATAARLDEFGAVVLDALDGIATRLQRIDGFANAPLSAERWEAAPAGASAPARPGREDTGTARPAREDSSAQSGDDAPRVDAGSPPPADVAERP